MNIYAILRPENASLARILCQRGHTVMVAPQGVSEVYRKAGIPVRHAVGDGDEAISLADALLEGLNLLPDGIRKAAADDAIQIAELSASVKREHRMHGLDALLTWTDAPGATRAAVLTARHLGIPTFELTHGCLNTYRQGHFECDSYVDCILAPGQEEVDFRRFYGNQTRIEMVGKPSLDWIPEIDKMEARMKIREVYGMPERRPIIVYGTTWRHPFSTWERDTDWGESAVFEAHMNLQPVCHPFLIVKVHPSLATERNIRGLADRMGEAGVTDYAVTNADSTMLAGADLLVSHKSSLLVEAVLLNIPAVGFDFRERNDFAFYRGKGIEWVEKRADLLPAMVRCLLDAPTKQRLRSERNGYFCVNVGHAGEAAADTIERVVAEMRPKEVKYGIP